MEIAVLWPEPCNRNHCPDRPNPQNLADSNFIFGATDYLIMEGICISLIF